MIEALTLRAAVRLNLGWQISRVSFTQAIAEASHPRLHFWAVAKLIPSDCGLLSVAHNWEDDNLINLNFLKYCLGSVHSKWHLTGVAQKFRQGSRILFEKGIENINFYCFYLRDTIVPNGCLAVQKWETILAAGRWKLASGSLRNLLIGKTQDN